MTVPSLRRRRGLLLRSATFCFSLERTFKLGSEAGEKAAGAQTHAHKWTHLQPNLAPPHSHLCPPPHPTPISWEARLYSLTCFAEGEVIAAVVGPKQRQFVGGRRPRGAALGRGTLVQRSMVGSPAGWREGMETDVGYHPTSWTGHQAIYIYETSTAYGNRKWILGRAARRRTGVGVSSPSRDYRAPIWLQAKSPLPSCSQAAPEQDTSATHACQGPFTSIWDAVGGNG